VRTADDVGLDSEVLCAEHDIGSSDLLGRCVVMISRLLSKIRLPEEVGACTRDLSEATVGTWGCQYYMNNIATRD
jgi:hypothetical protein